MASTSNKESEFLAEELKELRQKLTRAVQDARQLERYALTLTGAIWAWLLTHDPNKLPRIAWWIPFFLSCLALVRVFSIFRETKWLSEYIRRNVEKKGVFLETATGWETFVNQRPHEAWLRPAGAFVFWVAILLVTGVGPIWLTCR